MEVKAYSPSLLLSLSDQILPYSVLKLIPGVYIPPEGQPDKDPFLSPLHTENEVIDYLNKWINYGLDFEEVPSCEDYGW